MLYKTLRRFANTLTADGKYSLLNRDNLTQSIQMLLSQKQKNFPQFISPLLKSTLNFKRFQKKNTVIADVFPKLQTPQKVIR